MVCLYIFYTLRMFFCLIMHNWLSGAAMMLNNFPMGINKVILLLILISSLQYMQCVRRECISDIKLGDGTKGIMENNKLNRGKTFILTVMSCLAGETQSKLHLFRSSIIFNFKHRKCSWTAGLIFKPWHVKNIQIGMLTVKVVFFTVALSGKRADSASLNRSKGFRVFGSDEYWIWAGGSHLHIVKCGV